MFGRKFFPDDVLVPRARRVELYIPEHLLGKPSSICYEIGVIYDKGKFDGCEYIGDVRASLEISEGKKRNWEVKFLPSVNKRSEGQKEVSLKSARDAKSARIFAYNEARRIATKIARKNGIDLEDKVEDQHLAHKIDSLQKNRTSIFILSTLAGLALTIYSLTLSSGLTGYAISNTLGTTHGLLGIVFNLGRK